MLVLILLMLLLTIVRRFGRTVHRFVELSWFKVMLTREERVKYMLEGD
jgi:hypothetical protein